jgi:hypothetical protein
MLRIAVNQSRERPQVGSMSVRDRTRHLVPEATERPSIARSRQREHVLQQLRHVENREVVLSGSEALGDNLAARQPSVGPP